jgi:hypothetical protein
MSHFAILASRHSELTLCRAEIIDFQQLLSYSSVLGAHYRAHKNVVLQLESVPAPSFSLIFDVKPLEKYLAFEPRTETTSQIYSLSKFTSLRCENKM